MGVRYVSLIALFACVSVATAGEWGAWTVYGGGMAECGLYIDRDYPSMFMYGLGARSDGIIDYDIIDHSPRERLTNAGFESSTDKRVGLAWKIDWKYTEADEAYLMEHAFNGVDGREWGYVQFKIEIYDSPTSNEDVTSILVGKFPDSGASGTVPCWLLWDADDGGPGYPGPLGFVYTLGFCADKYYCLSYHQKKTVEMIAENGQHIDYYLSNSERVYWFQVKAELWYQNTLGQYVKLAESPWSPRVGCTDILYPTPTPVPTNTPVPTSTPVPTDTPIPPGTPTATPTPTSTDTPTPTNTNTPTPTPTPYPQLPAPTVVIYDFPVDSDGVLDIHITAYPGVPYPVNHVGFDVFQVKYQVIGESEVFPAGLFDVSEFEIVLTNANTYALIVVPKAASGQPYRDGNAGYAIVTVDFPPTATPTPTSTITPTPIPTDTPTPSATPTSINPTSTPSATPTSTLTPTNTNTPTPTDTPTNTPTPTDTPTPTPTSTPTEAVGPTLPPTNTPSPTNTTVPPTVTPSPTPTVTPTPTNTDVPMPTATTTPTPTEAVGPTPPPPDTATPTVTPTPYSVPPPVFVSGSPEFDGANLLVRIHWAYPSGLVSGSEAEIYAIDEVRMPNTNDVSGWSFLGSFVQPYNSTLYDTLLSEGYVTVKGRIAEPDGRKSAFRGQILQLPTPTAIPTNTPTSTDTPTPNNSPTPTPTNTATITPTPTVTHTPKPLPFLYGIDYRTGTPRPYQINGQW